MITKLANAKDNWFFKILSAAVAVSFVSLFGVSGYISSASQNQTVVKVGKSKTSQSEFSYRLQKEINNLKNLSGDDFEVTEDMRTALAESVLKQIVDDSVLDQTMIKYGIHFPKAFVQQIIFRQPEFVNPMNGQFHSELFKRYLSGIGMSEQEYVQTVKRAMVKKMLVSDLLIPFHVPAVLQSAVHKMDNQRKSFKYTIINPEDMKIERKISDEEIRQYFEDFAEQFTIPEKRDVKVLYIPNSVILQKYGATEEMAEDYFAQHKKELDQPEKRLIEQMVFLDEETANNAFEAIKNGKDFADTAVQFKAENADNPSLGEVAEDELAEDLADTFAMAVDEVKVLPVADSWQVIRVKQVIPAKEAVFEEVKSQIMQTLADENLYDAIREAKAVIDDAVNAEQNLDNVAKTFGVEPVEVKGVSEETLVTDAPESVKDLTKSLDFNELVFSYGADEITATEEFDDGIAAVQIVNIIDSHLPEIDDVKDEIITLWTVQEKNALAKETADNVAADIEDGSTLPDAAKARRLEAFRSEPISRNETFAGLGESEIHELFLAEDGQIKVFERPNSQYILVTPFETVNYNDEPSEESIKSVQARAQNYMYNDMSKAAIDNLANDFKIEIDYKRAGFAE